MMFTNKFHNHENVTVKLISLDYVLENIKKYFPKHNK